MGGFSLLAESVRFELTVGRPITSFQDWLLKPLGQLSIGHHYNMFAGKSQVERCQLERQTYPFGNLSEVSQRILRI